MKLNKGAILNSPKDYGTSDDEKALDLNPVRHKWLTEFISIHVTYSTMGETSHQVLLVCVGGGDTHVTQVPPSLKPKHNLQAKNR